MQMLSAWPLLIALLNGPSSVTVELGGNVPVVWSCPATAMPAPCRPSSGQLCAITCAAPAVTDSTSVYGVKEAHGWVVGRGCADSVTLGAKVETGAVLARVSTVRSAQSETGAAPCR